nr:hypothetical protein [Angustibacter aerolatus]
MRAQPRCPTWPTTSSLDLRDPASGRFGCRATIRFASTTAETFLELADAVDVTVEPGRRAGRPRVRRRPDPADRAARPAHGGGRGPRAVRDRRRRHAPVHRPRRRRDLRLGVPRHGRQPARLPVLRPGRPQGAVHRAGHRRPGVDGAGQRPRGVVVRRRAAVRDHPADPARPGGRLRRALALGALGARRAALRLARAALAGRRPRPRRRRACGEPPRPASTTTPRCSTSRTPSTPTTRCSRPARTGVRSRRRAA